MPDRSAGLFFVPGGSSLVTHTPLMRTYRSSLRPRSARPLPARSAALDLMRPSDAFATPPASRLADPARWLRPTIVTLAILSALAAFTVARLS
jgi:hypothetical protein